MLSGQFLQKHFWKLVIFAGVLILSALCFAFYIMVVYPSQRDVAIAERLEAAGYQADIKWIGGHTGWERFEKHFPNRWRRRLTTVSMPIWRTNAASEIELVALSGLRDLQYLTLAAPSNDSHFETLWPQTGVFDLHLQGKGFTDRSLSHLLKVSENTLPDRMSLILDSTSISDRGFVEYLKSQGGKLSWLHLRREVNLKPELSTIVAEVERLKLALGLDGLDLEASDLVHLKNRKFKMLDINQKHLNLSDLPPMECEALWLQDDDGFTKEELAPLARLKIGEFYLSQNWLTNEDVKFLTDAGVQVGWLP